MKKFLCLMLLINNFSLHANEMNLNEIDALQQQRQMHKNQALSSDFKTKVNINLEKTEEFPSFLHQKENCQQIKEIQLQNFSSSEALPSVIHSAYEKALQKLNLSLPYCFDNQILSALMQQIQNNIIDKGYVTTRILAQEQDLNSEKLVLTVILGKIGKIIISDHSEKPRFSNLQSWNSLVFAKDDLLNIRNLEQSLENLKRMPSADVNIEIFPNKNIGISDLEIIYKQALPYRFSLNLDDSGSTSSGKYQASANFNFDNLLSASDILQISATHSLRSKNDDFGKRASKNLSFQYSIPFGFSTISASQNYGRYHQEIFGAFNNYLYSGKSSSNKFTISHLIYRDSKRKTLISGGLWSRQSKNFIDDAEIEVQRRRMAGWEIGISHQEYFPNTTVEAGINFKRGTGMIGALSAPEELWNEGTSRPKIISASIAMNKIFNVKNQQFNWKSAWNGQWNKTPLIAQDRFSIGGRYTVRGFDGELSLLGERGWLWRNDLSWNLQNGHRIYLALDAGKVSGISENQLGKYLLGSALGMQGSWKNFNYDIFIGKALQKPQGFRTANITTGFNFSYDF